jgi:hypothetical protein
MLAYEKQTIKSFAWEVFKSVIPAFAGFLFAYITFSKQFDANEKDRLNGDLNKLLDVNLRYPYVEDSSFIAWWGYHESSNSDSSLRYQAYCEYVFNFLQNNCEYFNYDKEKITGFVDMDDLVSQHKGWWNMPEQRDSESYPKRFRDFIERDFK